MGSAYSKVDKNEALRLCKARKSFIKEAIDSRYSLAAAHVSYIESLRNIGIALRRYSEAEVLMESSLSTTSATELDKTPSHSSYPSPSPSQLVDVSDSPLRNESPTHSAPGTRLSYMKSGGASAVTVSLNPASANHFLDDDSVAFSMPPPPPPPPELGTSWDFFDPSEDGESFQFMGHGGSDVNLDNSRSWSVTQAQKIYHSVSMPNRKWATASMGEFDGDNDENRTTIMKPGSEDFVEYNSIAAAGNSSIPAVEDNKKLITSGGNSQQNLVTARDNTVRTQQNKEGIEQSNGKRGKSTAEKDLCADREDPSEFITHRAKDFLSSIKDIEQKFFRASESGREISRMLESNKIKVGYFEAKDPSSSSAVGAVFQLVCCRRKHGLISHDTGLQGTKVIVWKRSTSSRSSSSRNPLTSAPKDDASDSGSDFVEEFCMIAGSHSSTLDRLFAWERKLYDEVKASESIRKVYDRKCDQLRHLSAKDCSSQVIDKTRAVVKDLHSRIRVALHSVDSISKRVEKIRDEELQPQLIELIQGFIRMWKAMLECHHAQYITISLAYHSKGVTGTPQGDARRQIMSQLQLEIECFGLSFANWINSLTSYVEALNGWLQNCIVLPQERSRNRRPWSPRRVLAPPIFVLCRDWSAGLKALPSSELSDAIRSFLSDLHDLGDDQAHIERKEKPDDTTNEETECKDNEKNEYAPYNLSSIHSSLSRVLDQLTKFSEASLKMYEDIRQKSDAALHAYSNFRPVRSKSV